MFREIAFSLDSCYSRGKTQTWRKWCSLLPRLSDRMAWIVRGACTVVATRNNTHAFNTQRMQHATRTSQRGTVCTRQTQEVFQNEACYHVSSSSPQATAMQGCQQLSLSADFLTPL